MNQHSKQGRQKKKTLQEKLVGFKEALPIDRTEIVGAIDEGLVYRVRDTLQVVDPEKYQSCNHDWHVPDFGDEQANELGTTCNKCHIWKDEVQPQQQESWSGLLEHMLDAWFNRTLKVIVLETDRVIPPPSRSEWKSSVREDAERLISEAISTERQRVLDEVRGLVEGMKKSGIEIQERQWCKCGSLPQSEYCDNCSRKVVFKTAQWFTDNEYAHNQALDDLLSKLKELEQS